MNTTSRHFAPRILALFALTVLFAACESSDVGAKILKPVHAGMPRDSVMAILGTGPLTARNADTLRLDHGYRTSTYLIDGKYFAVLYYREQPGDVAEAVQQDTETPIVLANDKVLGWGWKFYVGAMEKYKLPSPITAKTQPAPAPARAPAPAAPAAQPNTKPKA